MIQLVKIGNTIVRKGHDGWIAKTYYKIIGGKHDGRHVKIFTHKWIGGKLQTSAQVMTIENKGNYHTENFALVGDPSKTLVQPVKCRVTDASVTKQHEQGIEILEADGGAEWIK